MQAVSFRAYSSQPLLNQTLSGTKAPQFGQEKSDWVKATTDATFTQDVIEASKKQPVLVVFSASWCGPCKTFLKRAEQLAEAHEGQAQFRKILVSDYANGGTVFVHNQHFQQYGGVTYPSIMIFANGKPQHVFDYYKRDEDGQPLRHVFIPGQAIGSPSGLKNEEISKLLADAAKTIDKSA